MTRKNLQAFNQALAMFSPFAAGAAVVAPPPDTSASHPMGTRRLAGWITGGAGVVVLGVGGVFGGLALSKQSSAKGLCPSSPCSSSAGVADNSAAKTDAWVADFGVGLGLEGDGHEPACGIGGIRERLLRHPRNADDGETFVRVVEDHLVPRAHGL